MDPSLKSIIQIILYEYNQTGVVWKKNYFRHWGESHLSKRKSRKEIPSDWTIYDYNKLIMNIMFNINNDVHLYVLSNYRKRYFTFDDGKWIVIVSEDGIMETAMVGNPQNYFKNNPGYTYLGKVKDVLT
ncbi:MULTISPECIES: hypothetical protein [Bacillaceae]|uniref:Uncharacterized protein n=1 Tax=Evansella alkalicola TaxID=745819 RepID=A0ABS6JPC4_9BACI|nr:MULTISPECIES: hypothetical protein [Bacillaceae]MBU9720280.1 hypothetical protein [Bacillus alkalicola]